MVYEIDPKEMLRVDRAARALGADIMGVFHSHTHTDAYPSPTDVAQAADPGWHYVLVSLRDSHPAVRSYLIRDGLITEEPVDVPGLGVPGLEIPG
jgi:proteasome lid subunit RPN8/RPN11